MNGFESYTFTSGTATARAAAAVLMDKITTLGGTISFSTTNIPSGTPSLVALTSTSGDQASMPWWNDAGSSRNEPAGTYWVHAQVRPSQNSGFNDTTHWGDPMLQVALTWAQGGLPGTKPKDLLIKQWFRPSLFVVKSLHPKSIALRPRH